MIDEAWIQQVKQRGLSAPLATALDVLEPLGPLGAQLLWIAQPVSGLWAARDLLAGLAEVLEQPGGVETLRQHLDEDSGGSVDSNVQGLTILIMLLAFAATVIATQVIRRSRLAFPIRVIPAYSGVPMMVGAAIEANEPVHMSLGSGGLGGQNTLLTLASAELFYQIGRQAAIGATSPLITTSDAASIPLGYDTLRRAYASRGMMDHFDNRAVRWFPDGPRSMSFAAAVTAMLGIEHVKANVLVGSFGPELALIAEATQRRGQSLLAASDQVTGQAIAYAMSDDILIGEELFSAGAYLGDEPRFRAALVAQDFLRWLLILLLILFAVVALAPEVAGPALGEFFGNLQRTLTGG